MVPNYEASSYRVPILTTTANKKLSFEPNFNCENIALDAPSLLSAQCFCLRASWKSGDK